LFVLISLWATRPFKEDGLQRRKARRSVRRGAHQDWRSWGTYPGKKYSAVAVARPEKPGEDTGYDVHHVTTKDGIDMMCVFTGTPKSSIRKDEV
jgi:hypothetical protein